MRVESKSKNQPESIVPTIQFRHQAYSPLLDGDQVKLILEDERLYDRNDHLQDESND